MEQGFSNISSAEDACLTGNEVLNHGTTNDEYYPQSYLDDNDDVEVKIYKPNVGCRQNFIDCSNVFKGFISAAFVGLPFGVLQSGVGLAIIILVLIAIATNHCCGMVVKCKDIIIKRKLQKLKERGATKDEIKAKQHKLGKHLSFGKIGKICYGWKGVLAVNISVMLTQLGFTTGYFIYLGNTLRIVLKYFIVGQASSNNSTNSSLSYEPIKNFNFNFSFHHHELIDQSWKSNISGLVGSSNPFDKESLIHNSVVTFVIFLIMLAPIFILISFIRDLRKLGPASVIANVSIVVAFVATVSYIIAKMHSLPSPIYWFQFETFPVYFGQVTAAFEGIGTVIPIEASMAENRHRYPLFLRITCVLLTIIFGTFGVTGYLAYGKDTCQILTANLSGDFSIALQCLIFVGVLFTYPLQIYPCIQITEGIVIKIRKWRVARKYKRLKDDREDSIISGAVDSIHSISQEIPLTEDPVELTTWEGNIIRALLVIFTALIALIFRSQFAYIASFTGSIGSSLLSYILPPLFQFALIGHKMNMGIKIKNVIIILFGIVGGIMGVTVTIIQLIDSFGKGHHVRC